ncbi:lysostaphin resistance A-like protein [Mariniluteicoccus flavus]
MPVVAVVALSEVVPPFAPSTATLPDDATPFIGLVVTAALASVTGEVFYRLFVQSRAEALFGRWPGILLTSLVVGLIHFASRGADFAWDVRQAASLALQGALSVLAGVLWSRTRRLWAPIAAQLSANVLSTLIYVLS